MKRIEAKKNEWKVIFGEHPDVGSFVYVWRDEQPHLSIDAHGIRGVPKMDKRFKALVEDILERLQLLEGKGYNPVCGDIVEIFNKIDPQWAKDVTSDVYASCAPN